MGMHGHSCMLVVLAMESGSYTVTAITIWGGFPVIDMNNVSGSEGLLSWVYWHVFCHGLVWDIDVAVAIKNFYVSQILVICQCCVTVDMDFLGMFDLLLFEIEGVLLETEGPGIADLFCKLWGIVLECLFVFLLLFVAFIGPVMGDGLGMIDFLLVVMIGWLTVWCGLAVVIL